MRLPTNNIAITAVGLAATILLVPFAFLLIFALRFARAVRPRRGRDKQARLRGVLNPLETLSETHLL